ncbi:tetratricopeptide repeat-containing sulfotransferase family protein [Alteromonas gilva]|uniref:Sulfotransferase n=1 Tax=Alteromonas gilva TaxID=2987522 RepID=A0ABT5L5I3_9ALTE|nr:tetratricopeptide repeat-containing sulfotransferase family protein [Alteromonas gilva]MDC8831654.1 sulfotransferase [Alteromonas gilva]
MNKSNDIATLQQFQRLLQQGLHSLNTGQFQSAKQAVDQALSINADSTQANFLSGLVENALNNRKEALNAFCNVLRYDPKNCACWAHIAELKAAFGEFSAAEDALNKAIKYDDGSPNLKQMVGLVNSALTRYEDALKWYQKATQQQPNNIGFLLNQATCLMYLGKIDEAETILSSIVKLQPAFATAHWLLSGLKKAQDQKHITQMKSVMQSFRFGPGDLAHFHYACGKEHEDLEQWSEAFQSFSAGAAAKRASIQYDEALEQQMYEHLMATCTEEWLQNGADGHEDEAPIFVIGEPRSGTSLVEHIISAHSQISSAGELKNLIYCISQLSDTVGEAELSPQLAIRATKCAPRLLGEAYMNSVKKVRGNTPHFVDKLPSNFLFLPLILKALPKAKIVHLRRDPMDTCLSGFKQLFTHAYPYSYDQLEMARHHARYLHMMETWRTRFGEQYLEVHYEELAMNFEPNARKIITYLGLDWEDSCLQFHQQSTPVSTASSVQVRQPVYTKSIERWKKYESQLQPMLQELNKHRPQ